MLDALLKLILMNLVNCMLMGMNDDEALDFSV